MPQPVEFAIPYIDGTTTPWDLKISPTMDPDERRALTRVFQRFTDLAFVRSRYEGMAARPFACFQAVDIWKTLEPTYRPLLMDDAVFNFDRKVQDAIGFQESGQFMLSLTYRGFASSLIVDVAGYLFGFPFDRVPAAMGQSDFVAKALTSFYQERYEGIALRLYTGNSKTPTSV